MSSRFNLEEIRARLLLAAEKIETLTVEIEAAEAELGQLNEDAGERLLSPIERISRVGAIDGGALDHDADSIRDRIRRLRAELDAARARAESAGDQETLLQGGEIKDLQTLVSGAEASAPFVLLPVRIETRFGDRDGQLVLLVRVFPDDIHGQSQGQPLDPEDQKLLDEFAGDTAKHGREDAIELLLAKANPQQAAWVVRHFDEDAPVVTDQPAGAIGWLDLLPRRWIVEVRVNGEAVHQAVGKEITADVRTVLTGPDDDSDLISAKWLRDFDEAKRLGMAIEVTLGEEAAAAASEERPGPGRTSLPPPGLDVIVLGVNYGFDADVAAEALERAMTGHAFGAGLRLLPKGSPTNNTSSERVAPALTDREQFNDLVEPPGYEADARFDAPLLERALGLNPRALASIARADGEAILADEQDSMAMAIALWPVTQGYPALEITNVPPPYGHFTRYVRAGGALPTVAVGSMPYGFQVTGARDEIVREDLGRRVVATTPFLGSQPWRKALESTPRIGEGLEPTEFLDILKLGPSSGAFQIRGAHESLRVHPPEFWDQFTEGHPFPSLEVMSYLPTLVFDADAVPWSRGLIIDDSDTPVAAADYLAELASWYLDVRTRRQDVATPDRRSAALLYVMLRYAAAMTAHWSAGIPSLQLPDSGSPLLRFLDEKLGFQPGNAGTYADLHAVRDAFRPQALEGVADPLAAAGESVIPRVYLNREALANVLELAGEALSEELLGRVAETQPHVTREEAALLSELGVVYSEAGDLAGGELVELAVDEPDAVRPPPGTEVGGRFREVGFEGMRRLASDPTLPGESLPGDFPIGPEGPMPEPRPGGGPTPGGGGPEPRPRPEPDPGPGPEPAPFPEPEDIRDPFDIPVIRQPIPPRYIPDRVDTVEVSQAQRATEFGEALNRLAGMDDQKLERLMTETLDATHYRRDAWTTSIHVRHLEQMRALRPTGSHLGGYGFVLGLRKELEPVQLTPNRRRAHPNELPAWLTSDRGPQHRVEQGGYIAAQTPDQAAALAVIRNAYLAHAHDDETAETLRMNLDSARVRVALELIDAVREANPPADVLGARFERLLHRKNQELLDAGLVGPDGAIATHLPAFREAFPNRSGADDPEAHKDRVVDGVALLQGWNANNRSVAPLLPTTTLSQQHGAELDAILYELEGQVDAANDLLLFEATFLATTGDSAAATRALDAHAGMTAPAAITSVATPPEGPGFSHRIVVPLEGITSPWPNPRNLQAVVSPRLNDWAAMLLGAPDRIVWAYHDGTDWVRKTLADTGLDALDVVLTADRWARAAVPIGDKPAAIEDVSLRSGRELTQHLKAVAVADLGASAPEPLELLVSRKSLVTEGLLSGGIAVSEIAELALRAGRTLRAARALEPGDVAASGVTPEASFDIGDALGRLSDGATRLAAIADELDTLAVDLVGDAAHPDSDAVATVVRANLNGAELDPGRPSLMTEQFRRDHIMALRNTAVRLRSRLGEVPAGLAGHGAESLSSIAAQLVGRDVPFSIPFTLDQPGPLDAALAGPAKVAEAELTTWFRQVARVVNDVTNLELVVLAGEAAGQADVAQLRAIQLPWVGDDPWIGGKLEMSDDPSEGITATISLCAVGPGELRAANVSGLFIGVLNDRVPLSDHSGGVAFRYDQPSARAPQVVAIAVPPTSYDVPGGGSEEDAEPPAWQWEHLIGALDTMIDDAMLRAADPNHIEGVGPALPMTLYPTSPSSDFYDINLKEMAKGDRAAGGDPA